jgi:hypothetical protein
VVAGLPVVVIEFPLSWKGVLEVQPCSDGCRFNLLVSALPLTRRPFCRLNLSRENRIQKQSDYEFILCVSVCCCYFVFEVSGVSNKVTAFCHFHLQSIALPAVVLVRTSYVGYM